ncbi:hypothetical protein MYU51_012395 [Penicillium brevicompactum]|uniref:PLP-dependent transferase n=1 Tax=Penicillium brevicompactum TaxID=5074 RepID=A0A9W9UED8_PENBR|nr:PLP-dependent transferase [Penicillium brevicompactum]KAJ5334632.1 PLP-dependent transferase [Penicillium brevicompactum]KAJ5336293.1 PLP-dependent transferase [Penicillium brevicompactum]
MVFFPTQFAESLQVSIDKRKDIGRLWTLRPPESYSELVNFTSNDFLSLNSGIHREETLNEIQRNPAFKIGAGASRVADGTSAYTFALEEWLAEFHNAESCLLFNSGYDANVAIFNVLPRQNDIIVHDSAIHASTHVGMRGSRASVVKSFQHNDVASLRSVLLEILESDSGVAKGEKTVFLAIESIYSMDGDIAPAAEIVQCVKECLPLKNAVLVVDEAHSNGIMGPQGRGFISDLELESEFAIRVHTFGKGINATGAAVLCPPVVKDTLVNYARNFIFTTAPAFLTMATVKASYNVIASEEGAKRRENLQERVHQFYRSLTRHELWNTSCKKDRLRVAGASNWKSMSFISPIVPLLTKGGLSHSLENWLTDSGFFTIGVGFPVVPKDKERVRCIIHADHTEDEIDSLVDAIVKWGADAYL